MRRWHVAALVLSAGVVLGGAASWRARTVRESWVARVQRRLDANAASTEAAIERWIEERRYDAATVAGEVAVHATASDDRSHSTGRGTPTVARVLQRLRSGHGYLAVWVLDREGRLVGGAGVGSPDSAEVRAALASLGDARAHLCDPFRVREHLLLCYAASAKAVGTDSYRVERRDTSSFAVVLRSTPYGSLFPLLHSAPAADPTEKARLIAHVGGSLVRLASSDQAGEPAALHAVPWSEAPELLRRGVGGSPVGGEFRQTDGPRVVASVRPVEGTRWAVVRQIDRAEVDRMAAAQLRGEGAVAGAMLLALALGIVTVARAERTRRLREIAASEARLVDTLRRSLDPVVAFDQAKTITFFNAAAERTFGWRADEVIGKSVATIAPPEMHDRQLAILDEYLASPDGSVEFRDSDVSRAVRRNGEAFPIEGVLTMGQSGDQRVYTLIVRDVTERLRHQAEREESLSLLRATLESTADGLLVVDRDGRTTAFNRKFLEIWGIPEDVATTSRDGAFLDFALRRLRSPAEFLERVDALYADPASEGYDLIELADGRKLERVSRPQRLGDRIVGRVWSFRDVTARELAASALRRSEASARSFVERSPYGICRVTTDGRFMTANPALVAMLGYPSEASLLRTDVGALYVDPGARVALFRQHARGVEAVTSEALWRRVDGAELPVRISSQIVRDSRGETLHYVAYVENLAPLRTAEHALRQAEKLAAVGGFVSGVAHELNNPLAAILLFADGLLEDRALAHERETIGLLRDQASRARAIVRDLLSFVRGSQGAAATVPAAEMLSSAVRALEPHAAAAGARLTLLTGEALGWVHVDRLAIEQVLTNLVVNAVQAAPGGEIRIRAAARAPSIEIVVEDDGPGIPNDVLPRVFEPFFTTKAVGLGTGLGLSVSLGIAERHGGTLRAENREPPDGSGARLILTLPMVDPPVAAPSAGAARTPAHEAEAASVARRVLIVDDEASIRRALSRFFERRHWSVDEAGDGAAALEVLVGHADVGHAPEYDLVISDLRMPGMSGVELHDRLALLRPELLCRLVVSTGDVVSPEAAEFVARTGCPVIEKPFQFSVLESLVERVLARRTAEVR